jgi:serine/threonine protein phosphatase PrpC
MNTAAAWRSGVASDLGLRRKVNEDRVLADDARGIFLVVDGLGGHAAGEVAAETAVETISERMRSLDIHSDIEGVIRQAITEANNRIFELAESHSEWRGMACVLTLAVVQEDRITLGHVGDSRLYLLWNGQLKKLTSDHSPVGEQEDRGALTEEEAMRNPRRNEVFRDVGSCRHASDDPEFIETKTVLFRPDAALLLSSDGLSDVLTSAEIGAILERYDGAPEKTAQWLVEAANAAGGNDNVSVVFVPGPEFLGRHSQRLIETSPRHSITRFRGDGSVWRAAVRNLLWLLAGIAVGVALWYGVERWVPQRVPWRHPAAAVRLRGPILVNPTDPRGIQKALQTAAPGDTIEIPSGDYLGPLELKERVNLLGKIPAQVRLRGDPSSTIDAGVGVVARNIRAARVEGIQIVADDSHPLRIGVWITNSSIELADTDISGAREAGVRIAGASEPLLLANFIHANLGPGVTIETGSAPRLTGNWIVENGKVPGAPRPGIEADANARPQFGNNVVVRNGVAGRFTRDSLQESK